MTGLPMESFKKNRIFIEENLREMDNAIESAYPNMYASAIEEIINHFQSERFQVTVVGEFSKGKSLIHQCVIGKEAAAVIGCTYNNQL